MTEKFIDVSVRQASISRMNNELLIRKIQCITQYRITHWHKC